MKINATMGKKSAAFVLLVLLISLSGCRTLNDFLTPPHSEVEQILSREKNKAIVQRPPAIEDGVTYANRFAPMALFAQTAYRKDLPDSQRQWHGCDYLKKEGDYADVVIRQMPSLGNGKWERSIEPGSCVEDGGMFFETYIHKNKAGDTDQAVIAFRGTETDSIYEATHDWGANLSGALPILGPEYGLARDYAIPLITKLHEKIGSNGKPIPIYLTGHSLGGGLAQHVAYVAGKLVTETYVFDTSPVTHWFQLRDYEQVRDPVIYRVYQQREVLEKIRNLSTRFNITRYNRSDYAFDFVQSHGIEAHSISNLTCGLAELVTDIAADKDQLFDYSKASAEVTLGSKLCKKD